MKLISQIVIMGLAISLIAGLMIPAIEEVAPGGGGEGPVVIDGKNDGLTRYSKTNDFTVTVETADGSTNVWFKDNLTNHSYTLGRDSAYGYTFGNHFQIYQHQTYILLMIFGENGLESENVNGKLTFKDGVLSSYSTATATNPAKTWEYADGFVYAMNDNGGFVRSDGTDGAIFEKDITIDGGRVGKSPRGYVQLVNGVLTPQVWGGTSGYGTIQPDTAFSIEVAEEGTTLYKITNNTLSYIPKDSTTKETVVMNMWFIPYEYHWEGEEKGETGPLANLFWILPTMAIVGVIVGAVRHITGRED